MEEEFDDEDANEEDISDNDDSIQDNMPPEHTMIFADLSDVMRTITDPPEIIEYLRSLVKRLLIVVPAVDNLAYARLSTLMSGPEAQTSGAIRIYDGSCLSSHQGKDRSI